MYYFSNTVGAIGGFNLLADKIYYLNKALNGCDLFYQIELPTVFMLDHPVGTVMGRAVYGKYFSFGQMCTVGNNREIYPKIGENVKMCCGSSIIGNCNIGNNVTLGAGALVKD